MYDYKLKDQNLIQYNNYMLVKTLTMFEYINLPPTIPAVELEKLLQKHGYAFITEVDGDLYAFHGGMGGVPDPYNNPTTITISNPALNFNKTLSLKDDGVLIRNDDLKLGLIPLYSKYHTMMIENDINILMVGYNSRMNTLISAGDDKTKQSAETFLNKIVSGDMGIIADSALFEGIKVHNSATGSNNTLTNLIELQQYLKGGLHNEIGLKSNFNMKSERLTTGEIEAVDDELHPFINNMMKNRKEAINLINEKYNLKISIDYDSIWDKKNHDLKSEIPGGEKLTQHNVNLSNRSPLNLEEKSLSSSTENSSNISDKQDLQTKKQNLNNLPDSGVEAGDLSEVDDGRGVDEDGRGVDGATQEIGQEDEIPGQEDEIPEQEDEIPGQEDEIQKQEIQEQEDEIPGQEDEIQDQEIQDQEDEIQEQMDKDRETAELVDYVIGDVIDNILNSVERDKGDE